MSTANCIYSPVVHSRNYYFHIVTNGPYKLARFARTFGCESWAHWRRQASQYATTKPPTNFDIKPPLYSIRHDCCHTQIYTSRTFDKAARDFHLHS
jgi:hypothetical protein